MNRATQEFPVELQAVTNPILYRRLEQLFRMVYALQESQRAIPLAAQEIVKRELQLLGVLREPLVGNETPDPDLATAATVPGTITDLTATGGTNVTITVSSSGPGNSSRNINVVISDNPTFVTVDVTDHYEVDGAQVVTNQQAAIPDAAGGATIDAEARTALNALLAALRIHGLIAT